MNDRRKIAFWADGTWCDWEELEQYTFMSDDFGTLYIPHDTDNGGIEELIRQQMMIKKMRRADE